MTKLLTCFTNNYKASEKDVQEHESQYAHPIKPIREGQTFQFGIDFENLHAEELGALLWVIEKARNPDYRLKIGMGKPYGLGSVEITSKIQFETRGQRYEKLLAQSQWYTILEEIARKETDAKHAFARWLFGSQDAVIEQVDHLSRIQELLIMLTWSEFPDKKKTRYMKVDEFAGRKHLLTGESGHFPKRPVLPTPRQVFGV